MVERSDIWVERAVEIRKVGWHQRCEQPGGCKYRAAIWLTHLS